MKYPIIHTDNGPIKVPFPQYWDEVSTGTYQQVIKSKVQTDIIKLISLFAGTDYKVIESMKDPELEFKLLELVSFIQVPLEYDETKVPEYIDLMGKRVKLPRKLEKLTFGQNIHIREKLDTAETMNELISLAVVIFLQPLYDGSEFNKQRADELHAEVLKLPITETFHIGFFFLMQLIPYGSSTINLWSRMFPMACKSLMSSVKQLVKMQKLNGYQHSDTLV